MRPRARWRRFANKRLRSATQQVNLRFRALRGLSSH